MRKNASYLLYTNKVAKNESSQHDQEILDCITMTTLGIIGDITRNYGTHYT